MANISPPLTAAERAARSVFVGNIPYEATEEQLKEIFAQVGPVVSFRLVYDRETGKPKGYGFCEYQDIDTAQSAMRNLNNYDFNGRPLRVGVAAGEQSKEEMKSMQQAIGGPIIESPYGEPVEAEKAPEAISKAVASLPPEQMYELMKQMKVCIQNNPNEARNMLLQNPQLAYALLQAQIVMKIVDPQVALAMLYRQTEQIPPLLPSSASSSTGLDASSIAQNLQNKGAGITTSSYGPPSSRAPPTMPVGGPPISKSGPRPAPAEFVPRTGGGGAPGGPRLPPTSMDPHMGGPPTSSAGPFMGGPRDDMDQSPRMGGPPSGPPGVMGRVGPPDPRGPPIRHDRDPRHVDPRGGGMEPRGVPGGPQRGGPVMEPPRGMDPRGPRDMDHRGPPPGSMDPRGGPPSSMDPRASMDQRTPPGGIDPRAVPSRGPPGPGPGAPRQQPTTASMLTALGNMGSSGITSGDQEKAALIMQVLQLSDQQIAMLPPDQRQSILILKEQIARSTGGGGPPR